MTSAIIDASIAVGWCLEDEASQAVDDLFEDIRDNGAIVPTLWFLEIANVLLQAEKRGRITPAGVAARLDLLSALPIVADQEAPTRAWRETLALARAQGLTAYDACYLELAVRRGAPLFTTDRKLAQAARQVGVAVRP